MKQAWARASFALVIPVAAFILGLLLAFLFTSYYFAKAYTTYTSDTRTQKEQLAFAIAGDLEAGDRAALQETLTIFAPQRARVLDANGTLIAGTIEPAVER